ncbi:MAG: hypothetical protein LBH97_02090 [Treponema sp.]|jgi:hypothetical protein|nr:hypothetical protein [Treponema sp.]
MNEQKLPHIFWSSASPLAGFTVGGLLIMASDRLAHAIIIAISLLWIYCLSALSIRPSSRIFPRQGTSFIVIFMASFFSGLCLFLLWLMNPLAAMETFFLIPLIPLFYATSGISGRLKSLSLIDSISRAASEALVLGLLIIILAIIREPWGFGCLSLPGGSPGIIRILSFEGISFLPIRLVASSAGALLLLGYGVALYRYFRSVYASREDES